MIVEISREIIHHYTSINTLALIFRNRKIRFNRLDRVDDLSEAQALGQYDLAKYLFVSCWTDSELESIPQWHMYTDRMAGVRISILKDFFNYKPLKLNPNWNVVKEGEFLSPIPFDIWFTDKYFILPNFLKKDQFGRKVLYVDNIYDIFKDAVTLDISPSRQVNLQIQKVGDLAGYKHKYWEFQQEYRFVLFILPSLPIPERGLSDETYATQLPNHIIRCILNRMGPPIDYLDVDINPEGLDDIIVTLGPLCAEGDRLIVEALLRQYTRGGKLRQSKLTGTIRHPIR